jgi:hypothetical protein
MTPRKKIKVPRYLVPLAKKIRDVETIIHRGLVVESPTVKSSQQSTGRVQLKVK